MIPERPSAPAPQISGPAGHADTNLDGRLQAAASPQVGAARPGELEPTSRLEATEVFLRSREGSPCQEHAPLKVDVPPTAPSAFWYAFQADGLFNRRTDRSHVSVFSWSIHSGTPSPTGDTRVHEETRIDSTSEVRSEALPEITPILHLAERLPNVGESVLTSLDQCEV